MLCLFAFILYISVYIGKYVTVVLVCIYIGYIVNIGIYVKVVLVCIYMCKVVAPRRVWRLPPPPSPKRALASS